MAFMGMILIAGPPEKATGWKIKKGLNFRENLAAT